ncbi:hypothetical protein BG845_05965 [Pseudonocardia autotrophica]|uniref:Uncharacterized protein n=1 Tax=Pseudonocardia autotrophica TaxID=2074 RepID=A0A1Y2MK69_PSEAH|nr:hypothetical protein BG845_05965 [Pseudonocardia autotrophica]
MVALTHRGCPEPVPLVVARLVAHVLDDAVHELLKFLGPERAQRTRSERKRSEPREQLPVPAHLYRHIARVEHVGARRTVDSVPVGVHLEQVLTLAPSDCLGPLLLGRGLRLHRLLGHRQLLHQAINAVLRIEMNPDIEFGVTGDRGQRTNPERAVRAHRTGPGAVRRVRTVHDREVAVEVQLDGEPAPAPIERPANRRGLSRAEGQRQAVTNRGERMRGLRGPADPPHRVGECEETPELVERRDVPLRGAEEIVEASVLKRQRDTGLHQRKRAEDVAVAVASQEYLVACRQCGERAHLAEDRVRE